MVGHMRKRWHVHALEAEPVLQTGPHGGDLGSMSVVEERDNPVHTYLRAAFSWEAAALSPPCVSAMPSPVVLQRWTCACIRHVMAMTCHHSQADLEHPHISPLAT